MDTLFALSDAELDDIEEEVDSFRVVPRPRDTITELREYHGWTLNKLDVLERSLEPVVARQFVMVSSVFETAVH